MSRLVSLLGVVGLVVSVAQATVLIDEPFDYANGDLTTVSGGIWTAHSGGGNKPIQVTDGTISLDQSALSGEDVNRTMTAIGAGQVYYAGFDFSLPSGQTVDPDVSGLYFAHFKTAGSTYLGRVFVVSPSHGGDFGVAMDANGSTPSQTWATDLSFDTVYRAIVSYEYDTGACQLWIDPTDASSTHLTDSDGTASQAISAFAYRQSNDYTGSQVIDNLTVATSFAEAVPEPATLGLLVLGGVALLQRRRRYTHPE